MSKHNVAFYLVDESGDVKEPEIARVVFEGEDYDGFTETEAVAKVLANRQDYGLTVDTELDAIIWQGSIIPRAEFHGLKATLLSKRKG